MRNQALERTLRLLHLLRRGRRSLDALALDLAVTTRTVRRDLEVLSVCGFAVRHGYLEDNPTQVWFIGHDGRCPVCDRV